MSISRKFITECDIFDYDSAEIIDISDSEELEKEEKTENK